MTAIDRAPQHTEIKFSIAAADKVLELLKEEDNFNLNLRVSITGGGCSGFQYGFSFDEQINEDDTLIKQTCSDESSQVILVIDSMSYLYLVDAEIDYVKGIQGEQFVIRNPNAKTTCGCGSSFSIDEEAFMDEADELKDAGQEEALVDEEQSD